ncbi:MAG: hypothetical protein Q7S22_06460 [Candidatus Micrarchaeota archaeon]|nr:hypothetical protein [Candidatus Micrarchaeota archaeon]
MINALRSRPRFPEASDIRREAAKLKDRGPVVRVNALNELNFYMHRGENIKLAVGEIVECLVDSDNSVRRTAALLVADSIRMQDSQSSFLIASVDLFMGMSNDITRIIVTETLKLSGVFYPQAESSLLITSHDIVEEIRLAGRRNELHEFILGLLEKVVGKKIAGANDVVVGNATIDAYVELLRLRQHETFLRGN